MSAKLGSPLAEVSMEETTSEVSGKLLDQVVNEMRAAWRELPEKEFLELATSVKKLLSTAAGCDHNN
jgi:hypothetical protein